MATPGLPASLHVQDLHRLRERVDGFLVLARLVKGLAVGAQLLDFGGVGVGQVLGREAMTIGIGRARQHGVAAAVCGELAGDPVWAPLLIGLGAHELSMAPLYFLLRAETVRNDYYSGNTFSSTTTATAMSASRWGGCIYCCGNSWPCTCYLTGYIDRTKVLLTRFERSI